MHQQLIHQLIKNIQHNYQQSAELTGLPEPSARVLQALRNVPRDKFVPAAQKQRAFTDAPLAIGYEQTISQPYIVTLMTDLLNLGPGDRVLEIGSGSGFQTAVLAELAGEVFSLELIEPLQKAARTRTQLLGYRNIRWQLGNGYLGWPEQAPFDAIIVTAGAEEIPHHLIEQLVIGGRLVIPVETQPDCEILLKVTREDKKHCNIEPIIPVRFVPLKKPADLQ